MLYVLLKNYTRLLKIAALRLLDYKLLFGIGIDIYQLRQIFKAAHRGNYGS